MAYYRGDDDIRVNRNPRGDRREERHEEKVTETEYGERGRGFKVATIILIVIVVLFIIAIIIILIYYRKPASTTSTTKCTTNANCTNGQFCYNGTCSQCAVNSNCSNSQVCHNGTCVNCVVDSDCTGSNQTCQNNNCVTGGGGGTGTPGIPQNVVVANAGSGNVTVTWNAVANASSYNVYRKANATVTTSNYDQKMGVTVTTASFTALASPSTQYFGVTAVNSSGESLLSEVVSTSICSSQPTAPTSPTVTESSNNCFVATNPAEIVSSSTSNSNVNSSTYFIFSGTGQQGANTNYFGITQGNTSTPTLSSISLTCTNVSSNTAQYILSGQSVTPTSNPTSPVGASVTITWNSISNVDAYAVSVKTTDSSGNVHYTGSTTPSSNNSLIVLTNSGDSFTSATIIGYTACNLSSTSTASSHISP